MTFFVIFLLLFITGTFVMSFMTRDFSTALGTVAATLGNIGPGIGDVGAAGTAPILPPSLILASGFFPFTCCWDDWNCLQF
jgi:Trk-type K+ transport system membrane component